MDTLNRSTSRVNSGKAELIRAAVYKKVNTTTGWVDSVVVSAFHFALRRGTRVDVVWSGSVVLEGPDQRKSRICGIRGADASGVEGLEAGAESKGVLIELYQVPTCWVLMGWEASLGPASEWP